MRKGDIPLKILINTKVSPDHIAKIQTGFPKAEIILTDGDHQQAAAKIAKAEVLITWWSNFLPEFLNSPALRWIHALSAGVDGFLHPPVLEGRVLLTNSSGIHGIPMAEYTFGVMLSFSRGLYKFCLAQKESRWDRNVSLSELRGKTLGVVGLGSIGQEIARLGTAFGMRVLGVKRNPGSPPEGVNRVVTLEGLELVLKESDFMVLTVPLTPETHGMIGAKQLAVMKPSAILINVARGEIVDESALATALKEHKIAGAGLDVFEEEPLPQSSPLWQLENCIITPHCSAMSPNYMARATDLFCRNLDAYIKGEKLPTQVDPRRGY
jgi:phosphoglycerate dehydrogenase-like enzyme